MKRKKRKIVDPRRFIVGISAAVLLLAAVVALIVGLSCSCSARGERTPPRPKR
jgi:hypothetical protein